MKKRWFKTFCALSGMLASTVVLAYDKNDERMIDQNMQIVVDSIKAQQIGPIIELMPPQIYAVIGERFNVDAATLKTQLIKMANDTMKDLAASKTSYRYDLTKAKVYQSSIGREYVVFPTKFTMDDISIDSHVVAIKDKKGDADQWYIVRIESPAQIAFIKKAYPDITDIKLD